MKTRISVKDIITYKTDNGVLIQNENHNIEIDVDALNELINDCQILGILEKPEVQIIKEEVIKEVPKIVEKTIEVPKIIEKIVEVPKNVEKIVKIIDTEYKKLFLISLSFNMFLILGLVLSILLGSKEVADNKTIVEIVQQPKTDDSLNVFQLSVSTPQNKSKDYNISIKKEGDISYGMWPIIKEGNFTIYTNYLNEFQGEVTIGYYGVVMTCKTMTDGLKMVKHYKDIGYKESGVFYRKPTKFSEGNYIVYLYKENSKDDVINKHSDVKIQYLQTILK